MPSFVRFASPDDLELLADIERAADGLFAEHLPDAAWGEPPVGAERAGHPGFVLIVAASEDGPAIGFAHVIEHDTGAHLEQLSVHPDHMRRGHGRALLEAAIDEAAARRHPTLTLRTYADIPWNAPFYRSAGFTEVPAPDDDFHRALRESEDQLGLAVHGRRVHMQLDLQATMHLDAEAFERLVVEELDLLPDEMVDGLENVVFVVEDAAENGEELFGLYDGLALTERGQYGMGELPDRIIVYRTAHLAACRTEQQLRDEVHTTLVHEIAHYYGIDDAQLHEMGWA